MVLAHNIVDISRTEDVSNAQNISFESMLLSEKTLEGLKLAGFHKPSPIQLHGIPLGKCGFDLLLEAKSGTGKTAVFSIISLEKIVLSNGLQVIIVAPTREIAAQICDVIKEIGSQYEGLVVEVVMGGLSVNDDKLKFKDKNVHIVVGSPGRLQYLIKSNFIDVSSVRLIVLDEADKLLKEKCFLSIINYMFSVLPQHKQIIMSSATFPESAKQLIKKYMANSQHVCPESSNILLGVEQRVTFVKHHCNIVNQTKIRYSELCNILSSRQFKQCLIFCNYQARVTEVYKMLLKDNWPVEHLYGAQEQHDRLDSIRTLKDFKCRILISSDLAARGIDASNVDLVVCFEPPYEWTTYLHRIGRAGRYGSYGTAITILSMGKEVSAFQSLICSVIGQSDSLVLKDLWTNKVWECKQRDSNTKPDDDADKINVKMVKANKQSSLEQYESTKLLNDILSMNIQNKCEINDFNTLMSSFENETQVQTFESLLSSFENIPDDHLESVPYCTIKLDDIDVKQVLKNTNISNIYSDEDNEINDNTSVSDNIKLNKSKSLLNEKLNSDIDRVNHYDAMIKLGLPTSFASKSKETAKKRKEKLNAPYTTNNYMQKIRETSRISNNQVKLNDVSESNSESSSNSYCAGIRHNYNKNYTKKRAQKVRKSHISEEAYSRWYNQLKYNTRLLEQMVYIREMSQ